MTALAGVAASPGSGTAPARVLASRELRLPSGPVADPEAEASRLRAAAPAARAVVEVGARYAGSQAGSDNAYLAARPADVREVCRLVAADLLGVTRQATPGSGPRVLVADDVGPADVAELDLSEVRGLATESGSRTSHTAVARALGIPAVVAVPGLLAAVASRATVPDRRRRGPCPRRSRPTATGSSWP